MRIGLLSDTHIPFAEKTLPLEVMKTFHGVDLIMHCGDIYLHSVLGDLEKIAPVLVAKGDDDDEEDVLADERVKEKHILKLEGLKLWLVHHKRYPSPSHPWEDQSAIPDIVVFGHEHRTIVQRTNGILFVNPGSPTFLHYCRGLGTVGILEINSGEADVQILRL